MHTIEMLIFWLIFFGYRLRNIELDSKECGFPAANISKIMARLEEKKINYLLLDRRNNFDVDAKMNYKNLNRYAQCFNKAKPYINNRKRIEDINQYLMENLEKEGISKTISKIEEVINERR